MERGERKREEREREGEREEKRVTGWRECEKIVTPGAGQKVNEQEANSLKYFFHFLFAFFFCRFFYLVPHSDV